MRTLVLPAITVAALFAAAPALAGSYDKVFFVKRGGTAAGLFDDREACTKIAENVGLHRNGEAFGDPEYGMISAMGAALEGGTEGGIGKAVRRAALEKCMEKRGWSQQDPAEADEKSVRRASRKDPSALDAWLKANEPVLVEVVVPAPPPATAAPAPAAPVAQATPPSAASAAPAPSAPATAPPVAAPAPAPATATPPQ